MDVVKPMACQLQYYVHAAVVLDLVQRDTNSQVHTPVTPREPS